MFTYETSLRWDGADTASSEAAGRPPLTISSPSEFGGRDNAWNPELLLVSAVEACLLLTLLSVVQRQKLALKGYSSKAVGAMEKTPEGLRFTGIDVRIQLKVETADDIEKAVKAVGIAEKYCPVSNAAKCPVRVTAEASA